VSGRRSSASKTGAVTPGVGRHHEFACELEHHRDRHRLGSVTLTGPRLGDASDDGLTQTEPLDSARPAEWCCHAPVSTTRASFGLSLLTHTDTDEDGGRARDTTDVTSADEIDAASDRSTHTTRSQTTGY
jgi:hypothetical protein